MLEVEGLLEHYVVGPGRLEDGDGGFRKLHVGDRRGPLRIGAGLIAHRGLVREDSKGSLAVLDLDIVCAATHIHFGGLARGNVSCRVLTLYRREPFGIDYDVYVLVAKPGDGARHQQLGAPVAECWSPYEVRVRRQGRYSREGYHNEGQYRDYPEFPQHLGFSPLLGWPLLFSKGGCLPGPLRAVECLFAGAGLLV